MLKKVEVGKKYLDSTGDVSTVLYIGQKSLFYSWLNSNKDVCEANTNIDNAKRNWSEIPKEKVKHEIAYHVRDEGDVLISLVGTKMFKLREAHSQVTRITKDGEEYGSN